MIKKIINSLNNKLFFFKPKILSDKKLKHFGTIYGGYDIYDNELINPTVISCGVGEDISFDIDIINYYNANIYLIDPTPRSKIYFDEVKSNFGITTERKYNETGYINPKNYNIKNVNSNNVFYIDKAFSSRNNGSIKLYYPKNPKHVSLSLNNKNNSRISDNSIICETIDYQSMLQNFKIKQVDILKLDIEGSEIEVLKSVLENENLPKQILVEFDIRRRPSFLNKKKLETIHKKIIKKYELININKKGDFTYILK